MPSRAESSHWRLTWQVFILALLFPLLPQICWGSAAGEVRRGNKSYRQQDYPKALEAYRRAQLEEPDSSPLLYNIGNVHYRQENWPEALKEYEAALSGQDRPLTARTYYNMGNALFRQGNLPQAVEAYKNSLKLDPQDMDAKYNLELALKRLQEIPQEQQQPPQDQSQKEKQQEEESQKNQEKQDQDAEQQQEQSQQGQEQQQEPQPMPQEEAEGEEKEQTSRPLEPGQMTPQEAVQLLDAIKQQEQKAQEEMRRARVAGRGRREYDW